MYFFRRKFKWLQIILAAVREEKADQKQTIMEKMENHFPVKKRNTNREIIIRKMVKEKAQGIRQRTNKNTGSYRKGNDRNSNNGDYRHNNDRNGSENRPKTAYKGGNGNRGGYDKGFDKDSDEEKEVRRKPVQKDTKPKEQQTDKAEIKNRLEKEKKAMKKKQASQKDNRSAKHQTRPKRSGNIDWTREYENDSYDDDDLDMYY